MRRVVKVISTRSCLCLGWWKDDPGGPFTRKDTMNRDLKECWTGKVESGERGVRKGLAGRQRKQPVRRQRPGMLGEAEVLKDGIEYAQGNESS